MKSLSVHPARGSWRWAVTAVWAMALVWVIALPAQTAHAQSTQTPWQNLTPSQLTAVWWQWTFSIPASISPLVDTTGSNAAVNQPYYSARGNDGLFFLGGTFAVTQLANGDLLGEVTRAISVKQGTTFFFPLLNAEWDNVCYRPNLGGNCFNLPKFPQVFSVPQERAIVAAQEDPATGLNATLTLPDGSTHDLGYQRLQSPPFSFTLPPGPDNLYGVVEQGTVAPAVSDGYWSSVPGTLAPGVYVLRFGGTAPLTGTAHFIEVITYDITITS